MYDIFGIANWGGFGNDINTFLHFLALKLSHFHNLTLILDLSLLYMFRPQLFRKRQPIWDNFLYHYISRNRVTLYRGWI